MTVVMDHDLMILLRTLLLNTNVYKPKEMIIDFGRMSPSLIDVQAVKLVHLYEYLGDNANAVCAYEEL